MAPVISVTDEGVRTASTWDIQGREGTPDPREAVKEEAQQAHQPGSVPRSQPAFIVNITQQAQLGDEESAPEMYHKDVEQAEESAPQTRAADGEDSRSGRKLSEEEQREVEELRKADRAVRQHEQTHASVGGQYVQGVPVYTYTTGPDGKQYATGGEISVDLSPEEDPEETIQKMNTIRRAAIAPADPSSADRAIAARAAQLAAQARQELAREKLEETASKSDGSQEVATGIRPESKPDNMEPSAVTETENASESQVANTMLKQKLDQKLASLVPEKETDQRPSLEIFV